MKLSDFPKTNLERFPFSELVNEFVVFKKIVSAKEYTEADHDHLNWIYERMKFVHGENENVDYMLKFKEILNQLR